MLGISPRCGLMTPLLWRLPLLFGSGQRRRNDLGVEKVSDELGHRRSGTASKEIRNGTETRFDCFLLKRLVFTLGNK